ncbi:MAG TPA: hypothetical protein VGV14_07410 [Rhodanobacter sp.]|nr:hypothetical protein [Rhodanobacter sp.]
MQRFDAAHVTGQEDVRSCDRAVSGWRAAQAGQSVSIHRKQGHTMHVRNTEAIRFTEQIRGRADALSGAAASISAAVRERAITGDEIYQLLDIIAVDLKHTADRLLEG